MNPPPYPQRLFFIRVAMSKTEPPTCPARTLRRWVSCPLNHWQILSPMCGSLKLLFTQGVSKVNLHRESSRDNKRNVRTVKWWHPGLISHLVQHTKESKGGIVLGSGLTSPQFLSKGQTPNSSSNQPDSMFTLNLKLYPEVNIF